MRTVNQALSAIQNADPRFSQPKMANAMQSFLQSNPDVAKQVQQVMIYLMTQIIII